MQVKETLSDGLKREFQVVLPVAELDKRASERLSALKDRIRLDGFRPGKVPLPHLKRVYGKAVMGEVIEQAISEANSKIVSDGGFKLAAEPRITLDRQSDEAVKEVIEGRADLSYTVALELLPRIELADFRTIELVRPVATASDADVDKAVEEIAAANRPFSEKDGAADANDRVVISFRGTIDGADFEGGAAEDVPLVLGRGAFLPGFEEQLRGARKGENRTVTVTFPQDYPAQHLAGKAAEFAVTVKSVETPMDVAVDDAFAKTLGLESLDKLRAQVRERLQRDYDLIGRAKMKRALLDALDERHKFEAPPSLVEQEFSGIWEQVMQELATENKTFADENTTEEEARADYRAIADRRVRLGLVLAEVGERNNVSVSDEELTRALVERARQYPGQEQEMFERMRKEPAFVASVRAPIFEDKVVDFLLELARIKDKPVTREQLLASEEESAVEAAGGKGGARKGGRKGKAKSA